MSATIHDLPGDLLGRILGLCGEHEGRSITLVSKHWHAAFYGEPSLWRSLDIYAGSWPDWQCSASSDDSAAKASKAQQEPQLRHILELLVQRVGSLTEAAKLLYLPGDLQEQLLLHLQPGVLKSLALSSAPWRYGASLPSAAAFSGFTNLTALSLDCPQLPLCMADAVAGMQQLRQLTARAHAVPEQLLTAAARLTQLTALLLRSVSLPAGSRAALELRSLPQLQDIELSFQTVDAEGMDNGGTVVMPPPACFPQLSRFKLHNCQFEGTGPVEFRTATFQGLGSERTPLLLLDNLADGTQLPRLLDALLPPSRRLASLLLDNCDVQPAAAYLRLSSLAELGLYDCHCCGNAAPVARMAQHTPALRRLVIDNSNSEEAAVDVTVAPITHLSCLTRLDLRGLSLSGDLPPGPYLARIQELDLSMNNFERVPPVLATAPQLRALDLSDSALLTLNESDVRLVLARMPTLDCLILGPRPDSYPPDDFPQQPPAVIELLRSSKVGLSLRLGTGEGSEDEYDWW